MGEMGDVEPAAPFYPGGNALVKVAKLHQKTMSSSFSWYGETVKFEYQPGARRNGTGYFDALQEGLDQGDPDKVLDAVSRFLVSWELEITVQALMDGGYYDAQMGEDDEGNEIELRAAIPPPGDPDELVMVPTDLWGLKAADLPQTVYGALQDAVNEDVSSGGQKTKKAR